MEYGASEHEQSQMSTTIKIEEEDSTTSTVYVDSKIDLNHLKLEPGLVQSLKSEPTMLVKKEIAENSNEDGWEQQYVHATATGGVNETCNTSLDDSLNVKYESVDIDIGPTVLQHMDVHYTINKHNVSTATEENSTVDDCNEAMPGGGVKKGGAQDKRGDNKATSQNCAHTTTEVDYDEAHMQSFLGLHVHLEKADLKKHVLHQHSTSSSNAFKCNKTFHKPQLLSARNDLYQRSNIKAVTTKGTVGDLSNQSRDKGIKTKQKPFACDVCEKGCSSKAGLNLHKRSHSSVELKYHLVNREFQKLYQHYEKFPQNGNFQCMICHAKFSRRGDLTKHKRVHIGEKPFECDTCHAKFAQKCGLTKHFKIHTTEKPYECDACHASFRRKGYLTTHVRVHTGEKPYECDACHAKFSQKSSLNTHLRIHTGEKPYECDVCHANFARRSGFTTHMRVHTGEKPYKCDTCHAVFAQRGGLASHMRVHTGEKSYECDTCHAKFGRKGDLPTHMRVHTGEKPYQCRMCNAKFAKREVLTRHIRVHTGEKPYECDKCHARFGRKGNLTTHMRVHTGEKPYKCDTCHAKFAQRSGLTTHIRVHTGEKPNECYTCHASFRRKGDLNTHMRVHTGDKLYQCRICNTKFATRSNLSMHMRVHTGEKPCKCDTCHAKFAQRSGLTTHMRVSSHGRQAT